MVGLISLLFIIVVFIAWVDYERHARKESFLKWYSSPLWMLGIYNTLLRIISKNKPFLPLDYFKGHALFQRHFKAMQQEISILIGEQNLTQEFGEVESYSKSISSPDWQCFLIKCYGNKSTDLASKHLPMTSALIQECKEIKFAMLSVLKPHTKIPPHFGPSKACYRYHLTFSCCPSQKAFINLDGIAYHWKEGEGVLFDDTYQHYVENNTDVTRIVLFCDVERVLFFPFNLLNRLFIYCASKHPHLREMEKRYNKTTSDSVNI